MRGPGLRKCRVVARRPDAGGSDRLTGRRAWSDASPAAPMAWELGLLVGLVFSWLRFPKASLWRSLRQSLNLASSRAPEPSGGRCRR